MADDDRRAGDWQKRDLRKNANDLIEEPNQKAWYKQTFWIVFFLIVFWPVGIVLCWRNSWHIVAKVLASVAVAFMVYFSVTMYQATQALMAAGRPARNRAGRPLLFRKANDSCAIFRLSPQERIANVPCALSFPTKTVIHSVRVAQG